MGCVKAATEARTVSLQRIVRYLVVLTLSTALITACKSAGAGGSGSAGGGIGAKSTLLFGFSTTITGSLANEGKLTRDGYQMWADTVNSKGGLKVGGKSLKVDLKFYDDESNANTAANNVQKLITQDKVDFLLGPYGSPNNLTAVTVAEKNKYVMLDTEGASNDIFSKGYHYVVGIVPLATVYPVPAIDFLSAQSPKPKLAVVWADDAFSKLVGQSMVDQAKAKGLEVVVSQQYPTGLKDFSTLITQMKTGNADVIFGAGHADEAVQIVKQEQQLNFHPSATIQTVGPTTPSFVQALGPAAEGQFGVSAWTSSIGAFKDYVFGAAPAYATAFKQKFGYDPDYHNSQASFGAEVLGLAIQKAGSLDQEKVLSSLHQLDVMTFGGPFKAGSDGSNQGAQMLLGQIQNGTFVAVSPEKFAAAKAKFPAK
jgi:branched-chain amino acid transport system substrate-binding protein